MTSVKPSPLPVLTSLRFFAALEVAMFHEVYAMGRFPQLPEPVRNLASGGYEAVTFFFVLSGFILTYVYGGARPAGAMRATREQFWRARFARIAPAYVLGLLLAFPHFAYSAFVSGIVSTEHFWAGLVLVPLLLQAWIPSTAMAWNGPAWSLSVEVFFYALFPWLYRITSRITPAMLLAAVYAIVCITAVARSDGLDLQLDAPGSNFYRFFPPLHLPQFLFGIALGHLYRHADLPRTLHAAMFWTGIACLVLAFCGRSLLPGWIHSDAVLVAVYALIIYGGARLGDRPSVLSSRFLVLLGESSYALYIIHLPVGWLWFFALKRAFGDGLSDVVAIGGYFLVLITVSVLFFVHVERPMRRWILASRVPRVSVAMR